MASPERGERGLDRSEGGGVVFDIEGAAQCAGFALLVGARRHEAQVDGRGLRGG